jgi:hypothetical protein
MQSFKNLAEGTFDEAFAKIVHTKLYQIRLLRHNQTMHMIQKRQMIPASKGQPLSKAEQFYSLAF